VHWRTIFKSEFTFDVPDVAMEILTNSWLIRLEIASHLILQLTPRMLSVFQGERQISQPDHPVLPLPLEHTVPRMVYMPIIWWEKELVGGSEG
jgi:hypothetical protein